MRTAAFFISLIVLLFGSNNTAMAGNGTGAKCLAAATASSAFFHSQLTNDHKDHITWGSLEEEQPEVLCEEVEDEDANNDYTRKFKCLTDLYAIPSYGVVLNFRHNSAFRTHYVWRPVSYKYLQLRNLRI